MPTIKVANGAVIKAEGSIELFLQNNEEPSQSEVTFYIFPDLPVQMIIGHATNIKWKAVLSWKERKWDITPNDKLVSKYDNMIRRHKC